MDTRETIVELHSAYRAGDVDRVAALIHDDIDWVIYGPTRLFPFEGPRTGKAQVMDVLAAIAEQFELKRHDHERLVVEGEHAALISQASFIHRASQRMLNLRLVNFMRVKNGQIIEFREFSDTLDVVEQTLGYQLQVPAIPV